MFGRGGEEAEALAEAGVRFEVVPGVTAGVAAPAYAGIPVTHRDEASAVAFVTAHEDPAKDESALDWAALAAFPGTLVFYMGVRTLAARGGAADRATGAPPHEPAAVVERGTLPRPAHRDRRRSREIAERARGGRRRAAGGDGGRAGRGAARAPRLVRARAAARAPGRGHARARAGERARGRLERAGRRGDRGAGDPDRAADRLARGAARGRRRSPRASYDVVCLTSPNGAELLLDALDGPRARRARAGRRDARGDRARARPPRSRARRARAPTSCPSARSRSRSPRS